jgi:hypothetical protein
VEGVGGETWSKSSLEYLDVNVAVMLTWTLNKIGGKDEDWFDVAQDRDKWRAVVDTVMNAFCTIRGVY